MAQVPVTPHMSTWIARRIEEFPSDRPVQEWMAARVREMNALPLMVDMGGSYAIRANGELVQFDWDGPAGATPLEDSRLINVALYQGSLRYPQMASLVPRRPAGARDCAQCAGTGRLSLAAEPGLENVICYCGGVGWRP